MAFSERLCDDGEVCVMKSEMEVGHMDVGREDRGNPSRADDGKFELKKSDTDVGQSEVELRNAGLTLWVDDNESVKSEREVGRSEAGLSAR